MKVQVLKLALERAKQYRDSNQLSDCFIEVEVESLEQVEDCLSLGLEAVLLDNMSIHAMTEAVKMIQGKMLVEASGRINLENIIDIAQTGVDLISIGALTHSAQAVDISLELD